MSMPKEPRQKMINIMYLVLTALLALNVSAEILNAFKTVNSSLKNSNDIIDSKNQMLFKSFQEKLSKAETKELAELWWPKAQAVQQESDNLCQYIESLKDSVKIAAHAHKDEDGKEIFAEDNLEGATRLFVEESKGKDLLQKLKDYKEAILRDPEVSKEFSTTLPLDLQVPPSNNVKTGDEAKNWSYAYFHMTPAIAAITILSKFQNDVKNSEAQIVEFCHKKIGEVEVKFDQFQPIVGLNSTYVMDGEELEVTAGLGAFSSAKRPNISINGSSAQLDAAGLAHSKFKVSGVGGRTVNVTISYVDQYGKQQSKPISIPYTVGTPTGVSVSADATKVLYVGVENPISISGGSGVGAERIRPSISQGNIRSTGAGSYMATVETPGEATITVNDVVAKKSTSFKFRVKTIPDPIGKVGNLKGGRIPVNTFKAMAGVRADLENFVFENLKYNVTGYTLIATGKSCGERPCIATVNGAGFNQDARAIIDKLGPNSTVMIDYIKVEGPGGRLTLPPISFFLY